MAEHAGVTPSIASRILNARPVSVSPATRERVLAAARELNYRPNAHARNLKKRRSCTLGVLVPDISDPFFLELIGGVRRRAREAGYYLLLGDTVADAATEGSYIALLREQRVDGLILASAYVDDEAVREIAKESFPFATVVRPVSGLEHAFVGTDDAEGIRLAVEHLASLGHTRIAHIAGPFHVESALRRLQGYRTGLLRAGLPFRSDYVEETDFREASGYRAMERLLALHPRPTAVVAASDLTAIGALRACRDAGVPVPQALSIVGFNDIAPARLTSPALTTVHMPIGAMGEAAVDLVLDALHGGGRRGPIVFRAELVVRESTAPPSRVSA